jgi:hypothetical protein
VKKNIETKERRKEIMERTEEMQRRKWKTGERKLNRQKGRNK